MTAPIINAFTARVSRAIFVRRALSPGRRCLLTISIIAVCELHPDLLLRFPYLGINADDFATLIAIIGKHIFVALYTVRVIISENVAMSGQRIVAMVAKHFLFKKLFNSFCFLNTEKVKLFSFEFQVLSF